MIKTKSAIAAARLFRRRDMEAAVSDHERAKKAQAEKTVRLRALRLAKEAVDKEIAVAAKAAKDAAKAAIKRRPRKKAAVQLPST